MAFTVSPKLVTGVIVLAGLAIGSAIDSHMPSTDDVISRPVVHEAAMNEDVTMRTMTVAVRDVSSARSVTDLGRTFTSTGTWVLVDLEVTATGEPRIVTGTSLVTPSGRTYGGSGDIINGCEYAQPGVPMTCRIALEVATEDLPGLTLRIPASGVEGDSGDDLASIDLGISPNDSVVTSPRDEVDLVRTTYGEGS